MCYTYRSIIIRVEFMRGTLGKGERKRLEWGGSEREKKVFKKDIKRER